MSHLKSQEGLKLPHASPKAYTSELWFLNSQTKWPLWKKHLRAMLSFAFGQLGSAILTNSKPPLPPVEILKSFHDKAINPISNKPIDNKYHYPRNAKTTAQINDPTFSDDDLELTDAAHVQYASDKSRIERQQTAQDAKISKYVEEDQTLLTYIHATMSSQMWDLLQSNPDMPAWNKHAPNSYDRSATLLTIMNSQFAKCSNIYKIRQVADLLTITQSNTQPIHEFTSHVQDQTTEIFPLIEDPAHPGYVKLSTLKSMIIINGCNKEDPNVVRALTTILASDKHQDLDKPEDLIQALNQSHFSDLNRTPTSEHSSAFTTRVDETSSAFAATTSPHTPTPRKLPKKGDPEYGKEDKSRTDPPCSNCLALINQYFYHKSSKCTRKAAYPSKASAHVAQTPPTTAPAQSEAERYTNFQAQALHFGYSIPLPEQT